MRKTEKGGWRGFTTEAQSPQRKNLTPALSTTHAPCPLRLCGKKSLGSFRSERCLPPSVACHPSSVAQPKACGLQPASEIHTNRRNLRLISSSARVVCGSSRGQPPKCKLTWGASERLSEESPRLPRADRQSDRPGPAPLPAGTRKAINAVDSPAPRQTGKRTERRDTPNTRTKNLSRSFYLVFLALLASLREKRFGLRPKAARGGSHISRSPFFCRWTCRSVLRLIEGEPAAPEAPCTRLKAGLRTQVPRAQRLATISPDGTEFTRFALDFGWLAVYY